VIKLERYKLILLGRRQGIQRCTTAKFPVLPATQWLILPTFIFSLKDIGQQRAFVATSTETEQNISVGEIVTERKGCS
jgi:hypothetical protein